MIRRKFSSPAAPKVDVVGPGICSLCLHVLFFLLATSAPLNRRGVVWVDLAGPSYDFTMSHFSFTPPLPAAGAVVSPPKVPDAETPSLAPDVPQPVPDPSEATLVEVAAGPRPLETVQALQPVAPQKVEQAVAPKQVAQAVPPKQAAQAVAPRKDPAPVEKAATLPEPAKAPTLLPAPVPSPAAAATKREEPVSKPAEEERGKALAAPEPRIEEPPRRVAQGEEIVRPFHPPRETEQSALPMPAKGAIAPQPPPLPRGAVSPVAAQQPAATRTTSERTAALSLPGGGFGAGSSRLADAGSTAPSVQPAARSLPREKGEAATDGTPRGLPLTVSGDIEVELRGEAVAGTAPVVEVVYLDYPRQRHKKGMTRSEMQRAKRLLHPVVVRTQVDAIRAVIETAADGIYEFRATTAAQPGGEAKCAVILFGRSGKRSIKELGKRRLGAAFSVVKVLMPEGVIWEDDSSFDGAIEDAESVTKYQSESGLVWKHYK